MKKRLFLGLLIMSILLLAVQGIVAEEVSKSGVNETNLSLARPLDVEISISKTQYSPGEKIKISGTARNDGLAVAGIAKIKINDEYSIDVINGNFFFETILRNNIRSGLHQVMIRVEDGEGNIGSATKEIFIKAIPSRLEIYLNNNSYFPESLINVSAILKDQNSEAISAEIVIRLYDSRGAEIKKETVRGISFEYNLPLDALPGEWWVYVFSENLKARRFFKINELSKVDISIEGNKLIVKNIGNIAYKNNLLITFLGSNGVENEVKKINLGVGNKEIFELTAPKGDYIIEVEADDVKKDFRGVSLTGGVVGVRLKRSASSVAIALSIISLVAASAFFLNKKYKQKIFKK